MVYLIVALTFFLPMESDAQTTSSAPTTTTSSSPSGSGSTTEYKEKWDELPTDIKNIFGGDTTNGKKLFEAAKWRYDKTNERLQIYADKSGGGKEGVIILEASKVKLPEKFQIVGYDAAKKVLGVKVGDVPYELRGIERGTVNINKESDGGYRIQSRTLGAPGKVHEFDLIIGKDAEKRSISGFEGSVKSTEFIIASMRISKEGKVLDEYIDFIPPTEGVELKDKNVGTLKIVGSKESNFEEGDVVRIARNEEGTDPRLLKGKRIIGVPATAYVQRIRENGEREVLLNGFIAMNPDNSGWTVAVMEEGSYKRVIKDAAGKEVTVGLLPTPKGGKNVIVSDTPVVDAEIKRIIGDPKSVSWLVIDNKNVIDVTGVNDPLKVKIGENEISIDKGGKVGSYPSGKAREGPTISLKTDDATASFHSDGSIRLKKDAAAPAPSTPTPGVIPTLPGIGSPAAGYGRLGGFDHVLGGADATIKELQSEKNGHERNIVGLEKDIAQLQQRILSTTDLDELNAIEGDIEKKEGELKGEQTKLKDVETKLERAEEDKKRLGEDVEETKKDFESTVGKIKEVKTVSGKKVVVVERGGKDIEVPINEVSTAYAAALKNLLEKVKTIKRDYASGKITKVEKEKKVEESKSTLATLNQDLKDAGLGGTLGLLVIIVTITVILLALSD